MSGRYLKLEPGRYTLHVSGGEGPAGVRRNGTVDVRVGINGGRVDFRIDRPEEVYYWWRGPAERPGVRLLGVSGRRPARNLTPTLEGPWPTATTG